MADIDRIDRQASMRTTRHVVLCGSMGVYPAIVETSYTLNALAVPTLVPDRDDERVARMTIEQFENFKRSVSFLHLRRVRDPRTFGVLAVNIDRHGIKDYIGPNTFAEIAVAFAQSKRIYLLQGIPEIYTDELQAWRAIPLFGDIERLGDDFRQFCAMADSQLSLF
jgi:hypothetical protein